MRLLALLLIVVLPCQAKPFYKSKRWRAGEIAMGAALALDAHSTINSCPACRETNPLLGPHPTQRRVALIALLGFGIESGFHIAAHQVLKNDNRAWRFVGDTAIPTFVVQEEVRAAIHNYQLK